MWYWFFLIAGMLIGMVLLLCVWLLSLKLVLRLDSEQDLYEVRAGSIARLWYDVSSNELYYSVFGWKRKLTPRPPEAVAEKPVRGEKPRRKSKRRLTTQQLLRKIRAVLQTFHVTRCEVEIDTGDPIANAYLFPVFFFIRGKQKKFAVRYDGNSRILLEVNNRLARIVRAVLFS